MPADDALQRLIVLEEAKAQNVSGMRNQEIGLIDLFNDLLRKGKYIVMATLAGMIPTGVFTFSSRRKCTRQLCRSRPAANPSS